MKQEWLDSEVGMNVVAVGLVTIMFSLVFCTIQDIAILLGGKLITFTRMTIIYYDILATGAALFSALTVFLWRPLLPRILIGLFSVSMASHVVEQFVILPAPQMKAVALCRIALALGLVVLPLRYYLTRRGIAPD